LSPEIHVWQILFSAQLPHSGILGKNS
jgi:hypothetical protein